MDLNILKDTPPWEWPEDAGEVFLGILRDDQADASDRLLAADLAGDFTVVNDALVDALLSIVGNRAEPVTLRAEAAVSLGPALEYADTDGFDDDSVPISESTFLDVQAALRNLYADAEVPEEVRRGVLEASVRAPQDWHRDAIRAAYASDDAAWKLSAVFGMCYVHGFDDQIIAALDSADPEVHYQAVCAAGNWGLDAAWPHVSALVAARATDKPLRLAAIDALPNIRPQEAGVILVDLMDSDDDDIVDAVHEAMAMAEGLSDDELDDQDDLDDDENDDNVVR